jgi:hypothetical protein
MCDNNEIGFLKFDENSYYSHKYKHFDRNCKTENERFSIIDEYISTGYSTVDFEVQKYIVLNKINCIHYILEKYCPNDFIHLIVTSIISDPEINLLKVMLYYYIRWNNKLFVANPEIDDVLWICLDTRNISAFLYICEHGNILEKYSEILNKNEDMIDTIKRFKKFDTTNPINPRNLVYALRDLNIDLALQLIEQGIEIDIWNNYPIRLCVYDFNLKKHNKLVKSLFEKGAKIPKVTLQSKKAIDNYNKIKRFNMEQNVGRIVSTVFLSSFNEMMDNFEEEETELKIDKKENIFHMDFNETDLITNNIYHQLKNKVKLSQLNKGI